jgi:hypothetical protein
MNTLIPSSLNFAEMMLEALFIGALYGIGFYFVGSIVSLLMEIFKK